MLRAIVLRIILTQRLAGMAFDTKLVLVEYAGWW